jgi:hypothetical protein
LEISPLHRAKAILFKQKRFALSREKLSTTSAGFKESPPYPEREESEIDKRCLISLDSG